MMYLITVILKTSPQVLQFHFDNFKDANKPLNSYQEEDVIPLTIEDDYGSKGLINPLEVAGIFLTDLDKEMEAQEKVQWAKVQNELKLQKRAQESPGARILQPHSEIRS